MTWAWSLYKEQSNVRRLSDNIVVKRTTSEAFVNLAAAVADLSKVMERSERFERLLDAFRRSFPCDAIALLKRDGPLLVPLAVQGLSPDTLGRRFVIADQPRLAQILHSAEPVRFPANSALPDPYDGLVEEAGEHLYVHDCMGAALYIEGQPWGVVTLDALIPGGFDAIDPDVFRAFVAVAAATARAADWIQQLEEEIERHHRIHLSSVQDTAGDELIGNSESMAQLDREVHTVAPSDLPVLILGETGVGKEMVARLIHRYSARAHEPIVYVNCAALPESLAESELFGHVRGAFSGASEDRIGKFELAHGGTLFLDEVGELPPAVQAKLLRALQNGEIQRIGSDAHHRVDVRVLAATNRDLKREIAAGHFRADLYHRLSVYPLLVPPLRERGEDILLLAGYFIERNQRRLGLRSARLSRDARQWLRHYAWPGNVRELEHTLSRAMIRALSESASQQRVVELGTRHLGTYIEPGPVPAAASAPAASDADMRPLSEIMDKLRREVLQARLQQHAGNAAAAARSLGIDRGNFHRLLKKLGLR
ncbi:MAG: nitric oxide reductase transcriptional regulator NorR [Gammaproteobacteria bacterium]|nr:nitric oxide reductase transcriptional regulator NorR [Gammaproteobacteria bacterium]